MASPSPTKSAQPGSALAAWAAKPAGPVMWLFLLLPLIAHAAGIYLTVREDPRLWISSRIDQILLVVPAVYLVCVLIASRKRSRAGKFLLIAYTGVICLLMGEVILRVMEPAPTGDLPRGPQARSTIAADTMPGITGDIRFTINQLGLRGPEITEAELSQREHRILAIGGSTTESLYVTDDKTWPWVLQEKLDAALPGEVYVGNTGKSGHWTLHHLLMLKEYRHAGLFNHVLVLCGINDWGTLLRNNYEQRAADVPGETFETTTRQTHGVYYRRTAVMNNAKLLLSRLNLDKAVVRVVQDGGGNWHRDVRQRRQEELAARPVDTVPANLEEGLERYRQNIRAIIELARSRGQTITFLTQPTMYAENQPERLEKLLWQYSEDGTYTTRVLAQIADAYNRALIEVCAAEGVACLDLASIIPKDDTAMYDDCHFNTEGSRLVAEAVAAYLLPKLSAPSADSPTDSPAASPSPR